MSDQFTEVTTTGYFQRLGGSFLGALVGIVLVPAAIILLYWNEGRAVDAASALDQGAKQVVEAAADRVDPASDGKLVHVSGGMTIRTPAKDPVFGATGPNLARLQRTVEMYQWAETQQTESHQAVGGTKTTETTYTYEKKWSAQPVNSGAFHHPDGHANPAMPLQSETFNGDVALDAYRLDPGLLTEFSSFQSFSAGGGAAAPSDYRQDGGGFYRGGDAANPAVGDIRVGFGSVDAQTISVVAGQAGGALAPYRAKGGFTIALAKPGVVSADELFHEKKQAEGTLTWILRGVGFVVMLVGFMMIAGPVSMLLAFLPFLEGIAQAGVFLIALTLSVPLTLVTIAIAWFAHRPLIGGLLIAAAIATFILFRRLHPKRARAATA